MRNISNNRSYYRVLAIVLAIMLLITCFTGTASAACNYNTMNLGTGTGVYPINNEFTVKGYCYYHSHSNTAMDIHSMAELVTNTGSGEIDCWSVLFNGGNYANYFSRDFGLTSHLMPGNSMRFEASAHTYLNSTVLTKPSGGSAHARIAAGTSLATAGWDCFWDYGTTNWRKMFTN